MANYKRHRFRLDAPTRHHLLRRLALLQIQSKARGSSHRDIEDILAERGITVTSESIHSAEQYENNRAEQSHESTRVRERGMRKFKSMKQAQRFVTAHAAVSNLFNFGRPMVRAQHYRDLGISAFSEWSRAVA